MQAKVRAARSFLLATRYSLLTTFRMLFHRDLGGAGLPPLLILHGFLGSSRNWQTAGAGLASRFHVYALDLRNASYSELCPGNPQRSAAHLCRQRDRPRCLSLPLQSPTVR